jgi:hypothetical protein
MARSNLNVAPSSLPCCGPSCCGGSDQRNASDITAVVREKYGATATAGLSTAHEGVKGVAEAFGYSPEELASIPAEANMGLSCGNPTATAAAAGSMSSWPPGKSAPPARPSAST